MKKIGLALILLFLLMFSMTAFGSSSMPADEWVPTSITLSETSLNLVRNQPKFTLTAVVNPGYATQTVKWESSDTKVVTVSAKGVLSAKKNGTALITCTSTVNSSIKAYCQITVSDLTRPVKDVEVTKEEYHVVLGKRVKLQYTITPTNASNTFVKWTVEDDKVCSVDSSGNVYGKEEGETTVTGVTDDGGFEMEFYIMVSESNMNEFENFSEKYPGLEVRRQIGVDEGIWIELKNGEYLFYDNYEGVFTKGWFEAGGKTYYTEDYTFQIEKDDDSGYYDEGGNWIPSYNSYTLPVMKTGWLKLPHDWTYLKADGEAARNEWVFYNKQWYYIGKDGYMKTDVFLVGSYFYVADSSGACQAGFVSSGGHSYYCDPISLAVVTGWVEVNGQWYYGDDKTGKLFKNAYIWAGDDHWYYVKADGQLLLNGITPEGHRTNDAGICKK